MSDRLQTYFLPFPQISISPGKITSATSPASHPAGLDFQAQLHSVKMISFYAFPPEAVFSHTQCSMRSTWILSQLSSLEEQRILSPSGSRLKTSPKRVCWIQNKFHILHLPGQLAQGNHPTSWIWQADTCRFSILNAPVIFGIYLLASEGFLWNKGGLLFNLHPPTFRNIWGWGHVSHPQICYAFQQRRNWVIISPFHQL